MPPTRRLLALLECAERCGVSEALVGDLVEELSLGRSRTWIFWQLIGLCERAAIAHVRARVRLTPPRVAIGIAVALLAGGSIVPIDRVIQAWLAFYCISGTLSLFAHMASENYSPDAAEPAPDGSHSS
jgi:hypothetical protein